IPYISMHGSTEKMISYFIEKLMVKGLTVKPFNLAVTDIGQLAMALVDAASIVIGTPTVLTGPHPLVLYATYLANALRPKLKFASIIGSYGWGGRTVDIISSLLTNIKAEILEPVLIKGYPKPQDFQALTRLAEKLVTRHKNLGITNHTGGLS
ncbi:MAG: flavodoxin domain-containing protein, partial [Candidatus Aminicenantales bacterium]